MSKDTLSRLLLLIVGLAPLPFGSHRPLWWSLLALTLGLLLLYAVKIDLKPPPSCSALRFSQVAFLGVLFWIFLQTLPISPHPLWQETQKLLPEAEEALSIDPFATWTAWMRLAGYGAVFWLTASLARSGRWAERALIWFVVFEALYAAYGIVAHALFPNTILWFKKWAYLESLTSTFVNRNSYATYAGLGILATLALLFEHLPKPPPVASRRQRWQLLLEGVTAPFNLWLYGTLALLWTALILTQSRAGNLSTLVAVAVLLLSVRQVGSLPQNILRFVGGLVMVTVLVFLALGGDPLLNRFAALEDPSRETVYRATLRAIHDHFWTGSGYGTFTEIFEIYRPEGLRMGWLYAHNTYLENALELGVPAFCLLLSSVAAVVWRCFLGGRRRWRRHAFPLLGGAATVLVALHSSVDFSLQIPAVAVAYAFLLGIAYSQSFRRVERLEEPLRHPDGVSRQD